MLRNVNYCIHRFEYVIISIQFRLFLRQHHKKEIFKNCIWFDSPHFFFAYAVYFKKHVYEDHSKNTKTFAVAFLLNVILSETLVDVIKQ